MADIITDRELQAECDRMAQDIFDDIKRDNLDENEPWLFDPEDHRDAMTDRAHEDADGHAWVIYTYNALLICAHCDTSNGEEFVDDVGLPRPFSLSSAATAVAYGEIRARIEGALQDLCEAYEAPDWPEDEPAEA